MGDIDFLEHVFPVVGGRYTSAPEMVEVCGTAFPIGADLFMTATHVLDNVMTHADRRIAFRDLPNMTNFAGAPIQEICKNPALDVAILRAPGVRTQSPTVSPFQWREGQLGLLEDAVTMGFPYAMDGKRFRTSGYKGHIIAKGRFDGLPGSPRSYELSFQAPRGLSGAPLLTSPGYPTIAGVVLGNKRSEMTVLQERERTKDGGTEIVHEKVEAITMGVAIAAAEIMDWVPALLGVSLRDYLRAEGLIVQAG
jgi:hypothetical protein